MRKHDAHGWLSLIRLTVLFLLMSLLAACGGGGGGGSSSPTNCPGGFINCSGSGSGSTGGTGSTSSAPTVTVTIKDSTTGATLSALPSSGSAILSATVKTSTGTAVENALVTFSTDSSFATLIPSSGTALTDSSGVASIRISTASSTVGGAATVTASTSVGGVSGSGTANYSVSASSGANAASVTVSIVNGAGAAISALPATGTVYVSATVKDGTGAVVPNALVTFATNSAYASLSPATGTALTNTSGVATIQMSAASLTDGGASTVSATTAVGGTSISSSTNYTVSPANVSIALALFNSSGAQTTTLSSSGSVTVRATVTSSSGSPLVGKTVKFQTSSALALFNPASGTAQTNSSGVATVQMSSAGLTVAGAGEVTANLTDTGMPNVTGAASYQVGAANVSLSGLNINPTSNPAYGTSTVKVTVNVDGTPTQTPITVSFTSGCSTSGKATLPASVLTDSNGVATVTYTDKGCSGTDTITVTVLDKTVQGTITSAAPRPANIQFVSASPGQIALKGTAGMVDVSSVTFKVVDASGNPVPSTTVEFDLTNWVGGMKLDDNTQAQVVAMSNGKLTKQTAADGTVVVTVQSGSVPNSVWVLANLTGSSTVKTQSSMLVVSTGLPTQDRFSLSVSTHNIEGWSYDGVTTGLTIYAFDRVGNPIPDGSTLNFITEAAGVLPQRGTCSVTNASCTITFVSAGNRPTGESTLVCSNLSDATTCVSGGRVTLLAYANGEESFDDANGNNLWESGETFRDLGDIYIDNNENGTWESSVPEQYFPFTASAGNESTGVACTTYTGYGNAKSKVNTCNGKWGQAQVRRDAVVVLSGSFAERLYIASSANVSASISSGRVTLSGLFGLPSDPYVAGQSCSASFTLRIADVNNNPMPAGTKIAFADNTVSYTQKDSTDPATATPSIGGDTVLDTTLPGGTYHSFGLSGTKCVTRPSGSINIKVTTPKGNVTTIPVIVN